jgi:hypothetical protein
VPRPGRLLDVIGNPGFEHRVPRLAAEAVVDDQRVVPGME